MLAVLRQIVVALKVRSSEAMQWSEDGHPETGVLDYAFRGTGPAHEKYLRAHGPVTSKTLALWPQS